MSHVDKVIVDKVIVDIKASNKKKYPKKVKQHKETKRISSAIRKGGCPTFSSKVNVGSWKNFVLVTKQVGNECPDTVITLGAIIETTPKALYIAVITPNTVTDVKGIDLISKGVSGVEKDSTKTMEHISEKEQDIDLVKLVYNDGSEQSPFKLIDQVFGSVSSHLKKFGVYEEEEEEYYYGFDDI